MGFTEAFKDMLRSETDTCQGQANEDSTPGFVNLAEWYIIWEKAWKQVDDIPYNKGESYKVIYVCIS